MSDGDWRFSFTDEVRFADLDTERHLNNVAFFAFFESARIAYVRSLVPDFDPALPGAPGAPGFLVVENKLTYRSPGSYGERIDTLLRPSTLGRTSVRCECEMRVGERLLADGYAVLVAYDRPTGRPTPIPEPLRERLLADGAHPR